MMSFQEEMEIMGFWKERALTELRELREKYKDSKELPKEVVCLCDQLTHMVKSCTSNAMVAEQNAYGGTSGYSGDPFMRGQTRSATSYTYDGHSGARGHNMTNGQYVSRDYWPSYESGHGDYLDQMIQNAPDMRTREALEMARANLGRR